MSTPGADMNTSGEPKFEKEAGESSSSVAATPTAPVHAAGALEAADDAFPAAATIWAPYVCSAVETALHTVCE